VTYSRVVINADYTVLEREIVTGMQLMGVTKLDELKPEMVECLQEMWR
jgi:vacuolar-type H+-ATPase subunit F/Vma7